MKFLFFSIGFVISIANSQILISPQLLSSAGNTFKNADYQLDWSLGELQIQTYNNTSIIIEQGFHQGAYLITAIDQSPLEDIIISVSPIQVADIISLKFEGSKAESMQYLITDVSGKVLLNGKLQNKIEQINFSNYSFGIYYISILQNNIVFKSFKIIKN